MKYKDFEDAFSAARLNKYKNACSGNTNKALTLYRHNVKLCKKFYGVLTSSKSFSATLSTSIYYEKNIRDIIESQPVRAKDWDDCRKNDASSPAFVRFNATIASCLRKKLYFCTR